MQGLIVHYSGWGEDWPLEHGRLMASVFSADQVDGVHPEIFANSFFR